MAIIEHRQGKKRAHLRRLDGGICLAGIGIGGGRLHAEQFGRCPLLRNLDRRRHTLRHSLLEAPLVGDLDQLVPCRLVSGA